MALRKPISYQWRLFIPLVAMLWFIIIALALFQYEREKTYRTQRVNDELRLINSRIIASYDQDIDLAPFMNFIAKYYENSVLNGIRVSIYDERGELLYCVGTPIPRYTSENLPPELADATEKGAGTAFRRSDENDKDNPYYYFGARTSSDGKIYVHTAMPYTLSLTQSMAVDESLWIIIIALAAIVSVIAYFTTRYLGKNISLLHDFANRAASDKDFNIDDDFPHDELGDISRQIISLYREKMEANERSEREHRIALKANEEKLRVTKQLANNINHELKTPVGVIKGYLDTLAGHPEMDEASRERFIEKAQGHMSRLCNMLNDLSSITRLEEGGAGVMKERVDFYDLLSNVSAEIESIKLNNGVRFEFDVPIDCYVLGNYNLLYGMVVNLIRNADFHSKGTMCAIKLIGDNSREYRFSFYDDGTGVGEEHLPHLFDRFYRIDKGRSRKVGGTGLGLPIVKNTMLVMGGTIKVRNRQPHGLEFVFSLSKWMSASGKA
jgi:signal transduction histidine kinase